MNYSESYYKIRKSIETFWPQWKIDYCNNYILTSAHARKLERKSEMKIFISQPMGGKTNEEIEIARQEVSEKIHSIFGEEVTILDTNFNFPGKSALYYLAKSLELLCQADIAYFIDGW